MNDLRNFEGIIPYAILDELAAAETPHDRETILLRELGNAHRSIFGLSRFAKRTEDPDATAADYRRLVNAVFVVAGDLNLAGILRMADTSAGLN